jgi:drug/metabolite transporter (DMT)-like permease
MLSPRLLPNLGLLLTVLFWGGQVPVLDALLQSYGPWFIAALRYGIALPVFWLLLQVFESGPPRPLGLPWYRLTALGFGMAGFTILFTFGIRYSNPVTAAVIAAAQPLVAGIVAWVMTRQPLAPGMPLALLLAIVGALLATIDWTARPLSLGFGVGELLIIAASVCWSWYSLAAQDWLAGHSQLRITGATMLPATLICLAVYGLALMTGAGRLPVAPDWGQLGLMAWAGLGAAVAGIFFWNYGVRYLGLVVASLFLNLIPIVAIAIATLFGAKPGVAQLAGAALVVAALIQAQLRSFARRRARGTAERCWP